MGTACATAGVGGADPGRRRTLPDRRYPAGIDEVQTLAELARLLRQLRRREARHRGGAELTVRELAAKTGWSHGTVADYFAGKILPPTERFDALVRLLGTSPAEQGTLATARDRVADARRAGRSATTAVVPRQLPPAARHFAGRAAEVDALDALLDQTGGGTVVISAIDGTAGIGKTTLAVHWAHRVADRFPDGQLYANLRGFDPGGTPLCAGDVVRGFLDALEVPPQRVPADLDGQASRDLLAARLGPRSTTDPRAVDEVIALSARLPLALSIV